MGARYRPKYLAHVKLHRARRGAWDVVLTDAGRRSLTASQSILISRDTPAGDAILLGEVGPRDGHEGGPTVWGYEGSGAYKSPRFAAESLAVQRIEGGRARQRFDLARAGYREPRPDRVRVVRLWWKCTICGRRFDTFGLDHDDEVDRRAAAEQALFHFDSHGLHLEYFTDVLDRLEPAGRTTRVNRHVLLNPFRSESSRGSAAQTREV